jgi:hypothetical protein
MSSCQQLLMPGTGLAAMEVIYLKDYNVSWFSKKDGVVYRGSCNPTFASDSNSLLQPRAEFCLYNKDYFDIGITRAEPSREMPAWFRTMHESCSLCSNATHLNMSEMAGYKYQVAIDGYGTSWDGTFWKLHSKSVVFWVVSHEGEKNQPLWLPFYFPLLKEFVHYIPVTVHSVRHYHAWCQAHTSHCNAIATAASRVMHHRVNGGMLVDYFRRLLLYLQDWSISSKCN